MLASAQACKCVDGWYVSAQSSMAESMFPSMSASMHTAVPTSVTMPPPKMVVSAAYAQNWPKHAFEADFQLTDALSSASDYVSCLLLSIA